MREITSENAADYLRASGRVAAGASIEVRELTGGVSNVVLYVRQSDRSGGDDGGAVSAGEEDAGEVRFVLKQARPKLRVAEPWFCNVERNWRELAVLRACEAILARVSTNHAVDRVDRAKNVSKHLVATTPAVLWEDRENYAFAMSAAPADHVVWKQRLLSAPDNSRFARSNLPIAEACGRLLGRLHGASWNDATLRDELGDTSLFDALRVDPYYRRVASAHADLRPHIARLIESLPQNALALVHADFSPKNLLVSDCGDEMQLMMVDFETGHFGDPAFDLGFFLSHLTLKAFYHAPRHEPLLALADAFWAAYAKKLQDSVEVSRDTSSVQLLTARAVQHLAGCLLARIDGKSPVEYLVEPARRDAARDFGRALLVDATSSRASESWLSVSERLRPVLDAI